MCNLYLINTFSLYFSIFSNNVILACETQTPGKMNDNPSKINKKRITQGTQTHNITIKKTEAAWP